MGKVLMINSNHNFVSEVVTILVLSEEPEILSDALKYFNLHVAKRALVAFISCMKLRDSTKVHSRLISRKIPVISSGVIFVQRLFEWLIFGGAYFRRSLLLEGILHFKMEILSLQQLTLSVHGLISGRAYYLFMCLFPPLGRLITCIDYY